VKSLPGATAAPLFSKAGHHAALLAAGGCC